MKHLHKRLQSIVAQLAPEGRAGAQQSLERLRRLGVETYDDLLAVATGEPDTSVRASACWYLARLGDERALPALARCLAADDVALRCEAARCLGILDGAEAGARLVERLDVESEPDVRMYAAHSLGMIGGPRAFAALSAIIHRSHEEPRVRAMAAESLAYVGDERAIPDLLRLLDDPSPEVRYWTVFALGQLGDASLIPTLRRLQDDHERPPGLGSVADEVAEAIEILEDGANDPDDADA